MAVVTAAAREEVTTATATAMVAMAMVAGARVVVVAREEAQNGQAPTAEVRAKERVSGRGCGLGLWLTGGV